MILFVVAETSDLVKAALPLSDPSQPWVVALAAELTDLDGKSLGHFSTRIKADGRKVREGAEAVHGISSAQAARSGVSEIAALAMLSGFAGQARYAVGHGIDMAKRVIEGVLVRKGKDTRLWTRPGLEFIDTMMAATAFCKIIPKEPREDNGYQWPKLDVACNILLGEPLRDGLREAWEDVGRVRRLFGRLRELKAFDQFEVAT